MSNSNIDVLYWTGSNVNTNQTEVVPPTIFAEIDQMFNQPIISRGDQYTMYVERFSLSLNAIPVYESLDGAASQEFITMNPGGHLVPMISRARSLKELISDVKSSVVAYIAAGAPPANKADCTGFELQLQEDGTIRAGSSNGLWAITSVVFPSRLNGILGFDNTLVYVLDPVNTKFSQKTKYARWDLGDALDHIRIRSNLALVSDTIGQAKTNVVTDFIQGSALTTSYSGYSVNAAGAGSNFQNGAFSYDERQRLDYFPTRERWLNISSPSPIFQIHIWAEYVKPDGSFEKVRLPIGGKFSIKLAFRKRNG